jgi:hypothetical protein
VMKASTARVPDRQRGHLRTSTAKERASYCTLPSSCVREEPAVPWHGSAFGREPSNLFWLLVDRVEEPP